MIKLIVAAISILLTFNLSANKSSIVAIVNNVPILSFDVEARADLNILNGGFTDLNEEEKQSLKESSLKELIQEEVIKQKSREFGIKVSEADINEELKRIENNLKESYVKILEKIKSNEALLSSYKLKLESNINLMNIARSYVYNGINISKQEIQNLAAFIEPVKLEINAKLVSIKTTIKDSFKKLENFKINNDICKNNVKPPNNINLKNINGPLSQFEPKLRQELMNHIPGVAGDIVKLGDAFQYIVVCARSYGAGFTKEEEENIANKLGNDKINLEIQKLIESWKEQAKVKIVNAS